MPSFDIVNYSLRPNKSIQRRLVFEGIRCLAEHIDLERTVYIGLGSIWFTDFQLAHKELQIADMISIESDEIGFIRAKFNRPFRTVTVEHGLTTDILPNLLKNPELITRPWIVWLDFDGPLKESVVEDLRLLVESAPPNSILLTTFNAAGNRNYGPPKDRAERLRRILGAVVPDDLSREACEDDNLPATIADLTLKSLQGFAAAAARPGGFVPTFKLNYKDGAYMTTVGGVLPQKGAVSTIKSALSLPIWPGISALPIVAPLLTIKEAAVLQSELPRVGKLKRSNVRKLGFDLEDGQIAAFEKYYRYYPSYAQITM